MFSLGHLKHYTKHWVVTYAAPQGTRRRKALRGLKHNVRSWPIGRMLFRRGAIPATEAIDVYDADQFATFFTQSNAPDMKGFLCDVEKDDRGAVAFILSLLQQRRGLRRRFPQPLSQGSDSGYCRWLCETAAREFRLSDSAVERIRALFDRRPGDRVRQLFDQRPDLRSLYPLALTPAGQQGFARWLLGGRNDYHEMADEEIWWFLFDCAEDPAKGIASTYLRLPEWQEKFPHGLTIFGRAALLRWVREHYGISGSWLDEIAWPDSYHPIDELRLLHTASQEARSAAPLAFQDPQDTERLVHWLRRNEAELGRPSKKWWAELDAGFAEGRHRKLGVNILGHFCYQSGLREAVRATVRGLHRQGIETSCRDVPSCLKGELTDRAKYMGVELYPCTLLHLAPEPMVDVCYPHCGLARRDDVYRIAVWYWELEAVPPEWTRHAKYIREIWAPTRFIGKAMRKVMPVPVIDMLPGVQIDAVPSMPRSRFGLPNDRFLFLFMFDMCSIFERKNPLGLIRAFRRAFGDKREATLAIKVSRADWDKDNQKRLHEAAREAGVILLDQILTREESFGLMNACDCYVSLHRSEGFGLTMAEAMLMGKPVIGTNYSGNVDFMSAETSLLVNFERVPITQELPFYRKGSIWAEPDLDHAAAQMRWVYEHPHEALRLGQRAREVVGELLSYEHAGRRMAERLQQIRDQGLCHPASVKAA